VVAAIRKAKLDEDGVRSLLRRCGEHSRGALSPDALQELAQQRKRSKQHDERADYRALEEQLAALENEVSYLRAQLKAKQSAMVDPSAA